MDPELLYSKHIWCWNFKSLLVASYVKESITFCRDTETSLKFMNFRAVFEIDFVVGLAKHWISNSFLTILWRRNFIGFLLQSVSLLD